MIPKAFITEWQSKAPWQTDEQVEQDLIICRALVEIFSDDFLSKRLAFRGGTALHKLFLKPSSRYSEDIDLVQVKKEPIGSTFDRLRQALKFLGEGSVDMGDVNRMTFNFNSESQPPTPLKLKVEINCREHFTVLGRQKQAFELDSDWYQGKCKLLTYELEELLGTKLRALYQRKQGRDLFDLNAALTEQKVDKNNILECYKRYISFSVDTPPSRKEFIENLDRKMKDKEFTGDIDGLIRPEVDYDHEKAYQLVKNELINKI